MDDFARYRVCVVKDLHGLGIGIEKFLRKEHPLRDTVYAETGSNILYFASLYLPHSNEELSINTGYKHALAHIHKVEPEAKAVLVGLPTQFVGRRSRDKLRRQAVGRLVRFRAIPANKRKSEEALAIGALDRNTDITEVIYNGLP
jgi:hypothetical protein